MAAEIWASTYSSVAMLLLFKVNVPVTLMSVTVIADIAVLDTDNVPVRFKSETVIASATKFVMSNVAEPLTVMSPNVAVLADNVTKSPLFLDMVLLVIPASSTWEWPLDANALRAFSSPVMSDMPCECETEAKLLVAA